MDQICPQTPVAQGVQTNCWRLVTILGYLNYLLNIILAIAGGNVVGVINEVIEVILFTMYMYHSQYFTFSVGEDMVEIKGGPCEWCASCNNPNELTRCCSASWCFSSQIYKAQIVSIEVRRSSFCPDQFPRYYCSPIMWCCCHKSYSGWFFPFCCDTCCPGDVGPVFGAAYIQFNLSESPYSCLFPQRFAFNIWSCCTYNRISYVMRDPTLLDQLKQQGYVVLEPVGGPVVAGQTTTTTTTTTTTVGAPVMVAEGAPAGTTVVPAQPGTVVVAQVVTAPPAQP